MCTSAVVAGCKIFQCCWFFSGYVSLTTSTQFLPSKLLSVFSSLPSIFPSHHRSLFLHLVLSSYNLPPNHSQHLYPQCVQYIRNMMEISALFNGHTIKGWEERLYFLFTEGQAAWMAEELTKGSWSLVMLCLYRSIFIFTWLNLNIIKPQAAQKIYERKVYNILLQSEYFPFPWSSSH